MYYQVLTITSTGPSIGWLQFHARGAYFTIHLSFTIGGIPFPLISYLHKNPDCHFGMALESGRKPLSYMPTPKILPYFEELLKFKGPKQKPMPCEIKAGKLFRIIGMARLWFNMRERGVPNSYIYRL